MDQMDDKIDAIAKMLGQESVPDGMKDLIKSFASRMEDDEEAQPAANDNSMELLGSAKNALDGLSRVNDPRINLLLSIKPFLNDNRKKKVSTCVNILRLSLLTDLFRKD